MHIQNFIKIHPFVLKIMRKNTFLHQSRAITLLKMNKKYCSIIQIYILSIPMHIQNLIEIHKLIHKILSINKILTSIKGHNSVKNQPKIMCIRCNIDLVYISMHIQNFIKIHPFVLKILRKNTFLHQSSAITLLFMNKFSPLAIPNHSSPISMPMQSLKKIGQKLLKLESGNEALTDGHSKRIRWYNKIPRYFFVAGYNKMICAPSKDSDQPGHPPSLICLHCAHKG